MRAEVAVAYDARAAEYVERLGSVEQMDDRDRRTIERWRDTTPGVLVDAGCGPGHWTDLLAAGGARRVVGVDASGAFLASARGRFPGRDLARGDLAALPLADASVGGVLAWYSLIHTPPDDVECLVAELARVLVPGGSALIGFFDGPPGEPFAHAVTTAHFWSVEALTPLLAAQGLQVEASSVRHDPGARRHGDLVARRVHPGGGSAP